MTGKPFAYDMHMRTLLLMLVAVLLVGCENAPIRSLEPAALSPEAVRVQTVLDQWPREFKRDFTATFTFFGKDLAGTGTLEVHGARDFRIKCFSRSGKPIFDARMNWAGITVLHARNAVERGMVESLMRDIRLALEPPANLELLRENAGGYELRYSDAELYRHEYKFDKEFRLVETEVDYAPRDSVIIKFEGHTHQGPQQVQINRPARLYRVTIQFQPAPQ